MSRNRRGGGGVHCGLVPPSNADIQCTQFNAIVQSFNCKPPSKLNHLPMPMILDKGYTRLFTFMTVL